MKPTPHDQMENWLYWLNQAKSAIEQGQSLVRFVGHSHPNNRPIARRAFLAARRELIRPDPELTAAASAFFSC